MNRPYIDALNRPAEADSLPLRKNDTVIGIIGKTQGVSNASSPQPIATRISPNSPSPAGFRRASLRACCSCRPGTNAS